MTEERRAGLETYLRSIAEGPDRRWRETSVWRSFLNLPSNSGAGSASSAKGALVAANQRGLNSGQAAGDPQVWLDLYREVKGCLHDARLCLGRRDGAIGAVEQYEAGVEAKKCLVKAGGLLRDLEKGLGIIEENERRGVEGASVGKGELRRRKDLLGSMRTEREGLEKLSVSLAVKGQGGGGNGSVSATGQDKHALLGSSSTRTGGRVLGGPVPETAKTRELDNEGVLQLQKQMMEDQDMDLEELAKVIRRQKEMGLAIHGELELQKEMLDRMDQDVDRVGGKLDVAKKRVKKIS